MTTKQKSKLNTLSVRQLNELYLGKHVLYKQYYAKIIYIAYYSNMKNTPQCEIQSLLDPKDTKIMPLSKVSLIKEVA